MKTIAKCSICKLFQILVLNESYCQDCSHKLQKIEDNRAFKIGQKVDYKDKQENIIPCIVVGYKGKRVKIEREFHEKYKWENLGKYIGVNHKKYKWVNENEIYPKSRYKFFSGFEV